MKPLSMLFKGKSKREKVKSGYKPLVMRLLLGGMPLLAIASISLLSSLPSTQAQTSSALTIRADIQEANSITGVVTATGNVRMTYPARQIDVVAEQAQYFSKEQRVVLTGNVVVTQEGINSIKAQTVTYLVTEGKIVATPASEQQVETVYVVSDREAPTNPKNSTTPVDQIKPAFKNQQSSPSN